MKRTILTSMVAFLLAAPLLSQDEKQKDNDPLVKDTIALLKKSYKSKNDDTAKSLMFDLVNKAKEAGPKDRKRISKGLADAFRQNRKQNDLYMAAIAGLGALGPEGAKPLIPLFKNKRFKKQVDLLKSVSLELGRTKDQAATTFLIDLLDYKYYDVIAGAAEGLAFHHASPLKIRKEIVEKLVKTLESAANAASVLDDTEAQRKYGIISSPLIDSLQKLSGQDLRKPLDWTKWWNNNKKKKDW